MVSSLVLEQRSIALATMLLTRHPDVSIVSELQETGLDLLVEIAPRGIGSGRFFGVELKARGTLRGLGRPSDKDELRLDANLKRSLDSHRDQLRDLPYPLLFMGFTMDTDAAFYTWLLAPQIKADKPILHVPDLHAATKWQSDSHRTIVATVNRWYDARRNAE